ncbi:hypothetical protein [Marinilactibacillus sp. 15R]|nr:hypothetical protein [Marinilactibacillus sp. 15R]
MGRYIFMVDRTNNRIVKVLEWIKEDWAKVKDPISHQIYLQNKLLLKKVY